MNPNIKFKAFLTDLKQLNPAVVESVINAFSVIYEDSELQVKNIQNSLNSLSPEAIERLMQRKKAGMTANTTTPPKSTPVKQSYNYDKPKIVHELEQEGNVELADKLGELLKLQRLYTNDTVVDYTNTIANKYLSGAMSSEQLDKFLSSTLTTMQRVQSNQRGTLKSPDEVESEYGVEDIEVDDTNDGDFDGPSDDELSSLDNLSDEDYENDEKVSAELGLPSDDEMDDIISGRKR